MKNIPKTLGVKVNFYSNGIGRVRAYFLMDAPICFMFISS
jgi:hypothetical protein